MKDDGGFVWETAMSETMPYQDNRLKKPTRMSVRDMFAAYALVGILANDSSNELSFKTIAMDAYQHADAMLEARKK